MSLTSPTDVETARLAATIEQALPEGAIAARIALSLLLAQLTQREMAIDVLKRELALDVVSRVRAVPVQAPGQPRLTLVPR